MCVSASSSSYGVGGCVLYAETSAAAVHYGLLQLFCFLSKKQLVISLDCHCFVLRLIGLEPQK